MIALCCAKCWIVQLSEQASDITFPQNQWGFHGNIIVYPQQSQKITSMLPPSIEEVVSPICVIFVGSSPPSAEWLCDNAKPLAVHADKSDIEIDHNVLNSLLENGILPFHIEHVLPNVNGDVLTSCYDATQSAHQNQSPLPPDAQITFQKLLISDMDGHASSNELRAAALRHVQKKKGGFLKLPHDPIPENEFVNPKLFPKIYPTLFPFGIGGFEDQTQKQPISLKWHTKHLLNLTDCHFQEHPSFMFTAFNILQS
ncbi:hypothetical protein L208DRAFT_1248997 [Tricholoma matsutake]|nr:hypothetical protein L208DRAFT_1248997 [Tricholoma matsutake 945]